MTTEAEAVTKLVKQSSGVLTVSTKDGREFLVTPNEAKVTEVTEPYGLKPKRPLYVNQSVTLQAADSLVDYVNRYRTSDTLLFADIAASKIVAVVDYHTESDSGATEPDFQANHAAHRASMELPFSEEWRLWTSINGKLMAQLDFARFIEENAADITVPSGGELLDAVRDLQAHRKVNFIRALRTASDNENFEFSDETEARTKGGIELPTKFQLSLPVYFGEPPTELFAFLRWRLDDGNLTLGVALHRVEHVRQSVFKQIMLAVAERTTRPIVFGRIA